MLPNWDRVSWLISQHRVIKPAPVTTQSVGSLSLTTQIAVSIALRRLQQTTCLIESCKSFGNPSMIKLLHQLHRSRSVLTEKDIVGCSNLITSLIAKMNEYIILIGEVISDTDLDRDISKALIEKIKDWAITSCTSLQIQLPQLPILPATQPRRDIAYAFSAPIPAAVNNSLVHATRIAFQCFECRILTLTKWYEKYFDIVTNHPEISSNESLFFLAIQELVRCGFIRKLTSARRKDDAYEKIALVWG